MAFELKVKSPLQKSVAGDIWYIADNSGDYHVTDNPTGWGAPNIVRSEYALLAIAHYRVEDLTVPVLFDTYDPVTQVTFNLPVAADGWIYGQLIALKLKSGGELDGAYVYNLADERVEHYTGGEYVVVDEQDLLSIDGLIHAEFNIKATAILNKYLHDEAIKEQHLIIGEVDCSHDDVEKAKDMVDKISHGLIAANYLWCDSLYYEFAKVIKHWTEFKEDHE